jgi:hypothetical protein
MNTIENINNIVNEGTVDAAINAVEAIPVKAINWRKLGKVGGVVGVVVGIGAGTYALIQHHKAKKAKKEAAADDVDNVKVAENDFAEKDSENK